MAVILSPAFGIKKTPRFNTILQETAALQGTVAVSLSDYPLWEFVLTIPQLQGRWDDPNSPLAQLGGIYFKCRGRAGTFLLQDPEDNAVLAWTFAVGDGTSKTFQLTRPIGSDGVDIVQNVNNISNISIAGVPTLAYTIDTRGVVTFNTSPANGSAISWTGQYDFRLRFSEDSMQDLQEFYSERWTISTLSLTSVIL
jgi:hypothetical protein